MVNAKLLTQRLDTSLQDMKEAPDFKKLLEGKEKQVIIGHLNSIGLSVAAKR